MFENPVFLTFSDSFFSENQNQDTWYEFQFFFFFFFKINRELSSVWPNYVEGFTIKSDLEGHTKTIENNLNPSTYRNYKFLNFCDKSTKLTLFEYLE